MALIVWRNYKTQQDLDSLAPYVDCAVQGSPYTLYDIYNDTFYLSVSYVFVSDSITRLDSLLVGKSVYKLNKSFESVGVQFVVSNISNKVFERNSMRNYRDHCEIVHDDMWKRGGKDSLSIVVLVYNMERNYFPGAAYDIPTTCIAVQKKFMYGSTIVHEMGHALGLYHTHTFDRTDGRNYTTGDLICDIPYHPEVWRYIRECGDNFDTEYDITDDEKRVLVENWMSYTIFRCRRNFTEDQKNRMRWYIVHTPELRYCLL